MEGIPERASLGSERQGGCERASTDFTGAMRCAFSKIGTCGLRTVQFLSGWNGSQDSGPDSALQRDSQSKHCAVTRELVEFGIPFRGTSSAVPNSK
jgi:hypothetical protein